jgi:DNA-binding XRE family transcriptional regulator
MAAPQGIYYREFGKNLAAARRAARITQEALAKSVGLSRTSIVNVEKGRQPVNLHVAAKMAASLETNLSALLPKLQGLNPQDQAADLAKISKHNRPWVERIITGSVFTEEANDATQILSGQTQSNQASASSKRKRGARSR